MSKTQATTSEARTFAGEAGRRGEGVRSDCWIGIEPRDAGGLVIELQSTVAAYYGESIEALVAEGAGVLGLEHGLVRVEDGGALPFVLMARFEAAVRRARPDTEDRWLPEADPAAATVTQRDRFRRSRLYLPGDEPKYMVNAGLHRPDGLILDLEDSVSPVAKDEARLVVRNALHVVDFLAAERMVRINPGILGQADLAEIADTNLHVVLIPKCESAEDVLVVDRTLRERSEREVFLMPILETAAGVLAATEIAASSDRIVALTIGLEDYTADLGVPRTSAGGESLWARSMVVHAARAAGLQAIDSVYSDVADEAGLRASVREAKALGFEGKGCIHPRQIRPIHEAFAPEPEEVERACRIVRAFEKAAERGLGVVSLGTKMIDPPVVQRALRVVEQARASGILDASWREEKSP